MNYIEYLISEVEDIDRQKEAERKAYQAIQDVMAAGYSEDTAIKVHGMMLSYDMTAQDALNELNENEEI